MFQLQFGKSRPALATGRNELPAILICELDWSALVGALLLKLDLPADDLYYL
ncbi:MAG TPA: hypothetical protein VE860_13885 [Chthoniobacterales bacterium]|jgi:hypothetical protein|nr:hypothetical protein [Chthoniobacterales bacterium]